MPTSARTIDELRAENALIRGVVDKVPAMLAYWDTELRCRFANRAYERWFGVSPEALIGTHIRDLLGPLYALNLPYIEAALRGEVQEFEREIPNPSGGLSRHSLANYVPDIVDGTVRGFFVQVSDISAIKRAEMALRESEARFSGIIALASDAIIGVEEDQRITIFNRGAERIFGYARDEVIGSSLDILLPPRLRAAHRAEVARFAAGPTSARPMGNREREIVGLRKNGEEFLAEAAISRFEVGGRTLSTVALRDVSERKRLEAEQQVLAEAGDVLNSSLDSAQTLESIVQLVVRRTADFCMVETTEEPGRVRRLTAAHVDPAKAALCRRFAEYPLDRQHSLSRSALETKQTQLFSTMSEAYWAERAQDARHLELLYELQARSAIVAPLIAKSGVLGALIVTSSRPEHFGERDMGLVTELARRAAMAIENARLYEAARRATQARDEVLGVVAHDLRNPLGAILLTANSLARRFDNVGDTRGAESVEIITRAISRANRLIQDLLDVRRIEAGALAITRAPLAPRQLLVDAVESQRPLAASASVSLRIDASDALPAIDADRDRLLQVLENLVGNAIRYTPKGGTITLAAAPDGGAVVFRVVDTGAGIAAENLPYVFDRFWQANRTERRGAGLGLPICKGIIEAHGGWIRVESTPGQGTTFSFAIPRTPAPDPASR